jgi:peptidoglycan/xylan/chitin deacetylase (PgdA/CDA1 family)
MSILSNPKIRQVVRRAVKPFMSTGVILMYHRIGEPDLDPWSLHVTPENFRLQMEVLRQYAKPISLRELAQAQQNGKVPKRSVAITFDDGYADNLHNAKPILERYNIPATFFITTGHIGKEQGFWWDELQQLFLQPGKLSEKLTIEIDGATHSWDLGKAVNYSQADYEADKGKRAYESNPDSRLGFYYSVWQTIQCFSAESRLQAMEQIQTWVGSKVVTTLEDRSLLPSELCTLAHSELTDIGAHTVTHPSLKEHSAEFQLKEIQQSKADLEKLLNRPVTTFAYPYGSYTAETINLLQQSGLDCACSTVEGLVWKGSDGFQLPRYHVHDWNGEEFAQNLEKWFNN